jgi:hypothetical protein
MYSSTHSLNRSPAPAVLPPENGTHCTGGWVGPMLIWTGEENLATTGIVEYVYKIISVQIIRTESLSGCKYRPSMKQLSDRM